MEYKVKSIIIGRKKRPNKEDTNYPCFVALFNINEPHKSGDVPEKILDFENIRKVNINKGKCVSYMPAGNDLVVDNLVAVDIEQDNEEITINCNYWSH